MAFSNIFIKAGFWKRTNHPVKGDLRLDEISPLVETNPNLEVFKELGGSVISEPVFARIGTTSSAIQLQDGEMKFMTHYFPTAKYITGVLWGQSVQGTYTADKYNGFGFYSVNGSTGVLTLITSSTNNGNLWKSATASLYKTDFSSPYLASPGLYTVAALWNNSASSGSPSVIGSPSSGTLYAAAMDFTNSNRIGGVLAAQDSLPTTINMSSITGSATNPYFALY